MKLKTYIEDEAKLPYHVWADKFKYCQASVYAWIKGIRKPNLANLRRLMKDTNGMVGPGDFDGNGA